MWHSHCKNVLMYVQSTARAETCGSNGGNVSIVVPTERSYGNVKSFRRLSGLRRLESSASRHFLKDTTVYPADVYLLRILQLLSCAGRSDVYAFLLTHGDLLLLSRCWVDLARAGYCNPFAVGRLPFCVVQFYIPQAIKVLYSGLL